MIIIFSWLLLSCIVGLIGSTRQIGFVSSFVLSLGLSPLVGLIITFISKDKAAEADRLQMLEAVQNKGGADVVSQLERLHKLKDAGQLSDEEFRTAKERALAV